MLMLHGSLGSVKFLKWDFSELPDLVWGALCCELNRIEETKKEEEEWELDQGELLGKWRGLWINCGDRKRAEYKTEPRWLINSFPEAEVSFAGLPRSFYKIKVWKLCFTFQYTLRKYKKIDMFTFSYERPMLSCMVSVKTYVRPESEKQKLGK